MVKLQEFPKFDPDAYKHLEPFDWLGRNVTRTHVVVAEHVPNAEGRVWEVECGVCRHAYIVTDSQFAKGNSAQPCRCNRR